jgi:hypothetical protein
LSFTSSLRERKLLSGGHPDHLLDQVDAGDQLGHRVLDLKPRVHFQEVEVAVLVDDEFHRAGRLVVHGLGQRHRLLAHGLARRFASRKGEGASSTTFWFRRWIEHSRSPR